ncbi:glycine--tRNA ligase [Ferroplasma sp.]|uniref:glycine--tRNA ligase n=1 Tax=Ferroplasma sp. TaxID=2591003 RepID=UPI00307DC172
MYDETVELAKRRGFFWPSFSIYGGFAGLYDYGPLGVLLKDNIIRTWKESYLCDDAIFLDTPNVTPEPVFKASGHIARFSDIAAECEKCKTKSKLESVLSFNHISDIPVNLEDAKRIVSENKLKCPVCGNIINNVYDFNLMFKVSGDYYLRPETAQGIFVNFKLLNNYNRGKFPMIVAQQGKGFRNEISPRQSLIRLREFNQCEVEAFFDPENLKFKELYEYKKIKIKPNTGGEFYITVKEAFEKGLISSQAFAYFVLKTQIILENMGIKNELLRFRQHDPDERAHYAADSWDAEALIDDEWFEIVGIANRTDFDLKNHQASSGEPMKVKAEDHEFIPYVIEPSYGIDRIILSLLAQSMEKRDNKNVLKIPYKIAPYHFAVFPLMKKENLKEKAEYIYNELKKLDKYIIYDDAGTIGKRYARHDEIGTPFCITIDYQTLEDDTVTLRSRDTTEQERIGINKILEQPFIDSHIYKN